MPFQVPDYAQKILSSTALSQKVNRMAYEILEIHHHTEKLLLLGIEEGGYQLAVLLAEKIQSIQKIEIQMASIWIDKEHPYSQAPRIHSEEKIEENQATLLVDDVGNTGKTLFHALSAIYPIKPYSVHLAVLIDRMHKRFPVKADVVGLDLATTLTEHIHVVFDKDGKPEGAYLF